MPRPKGAKNKSAEQKAAELEAKLAKKGKRGRPKQIPAKPQVDTPPRAVDTASITSVAEYSVAEASDKHTAKTISKPKGRPKKTTTQVAAPMESVTVEQMEQHSQPAQPAQPAQNDVLDALNRFANNVMSRFDQFDQRLSDVENARANIHQPANTPTQQPPQQSATTYNAFGTPVDYAAGQPQPPTQSLPAYLGGSDGGNPRNETWIDNESPLPTYSQEQLDLIQREGDVLVRAEGYDKLQEMGKTDPSKLPLALSIGRQDNTPRRDVLCAQCNRPPDPRSRGALPCDFHRTSDGGLVYLHENCIQRYRAGGR